ncbi:hypothetical protein ACU4GI_33290 [Cupriavidus basilensis]
MKSLAHGHGHMALADQVAGAVVRSATNHTVGALMRGHGVMVVIAIAIALIVGIWAIKRLL